jgi:replication factor C subunit 1
MKASSVLAAKKTKKDVPDLEEAIEESDDGEPVDESPDKEEEGDLSLDKYIKAPKKKAAPKANTKGKGKKRAVDSDAEESEPKKTKASASKPRAKAKK